MEVKLMRMWMALLALGALLVSLAGGAAGAATEQRITITMRDFGYTPSKVTLRSGVPAQLTIVNNGKLTHEFMLYGMPRDMSSMMGGEMGHEWVEKNNYFKGVQATTSGGKEKRRGGALLELRVQPGKSAMVTFTPQKKGTFEFSCMLADHYEAGQRGVLVVK